MTNYFCLNRGKFATVKRAHSKMNSSVSAAKYIRKRRRASTEEVWPILHVYTFICTFVSM